MWPFSALVFASGGNITLICVTLLVLWYLLLTYISALLCTTSNLCLALAVWGFQAHVAYCSVGLTRAWYARVFTVSDGVHIFLFRSPSVRFAVEVIVDMCLFQFTLDVIVTPRY